MIRIKRSRRTHRSIPSNPVSRAIPDNPFIPVNPASREHPNILDNRRFQGNRAFQFIQDNREFPFIRDNRKYPGSRRNIPVSRCRKILPRCSPYIRANNRRILLSREVIQAFQAPRRGYRDSSRSPAKPGLLFQQSRVYREFRIRERPALQTRPPI